MKKQYYYGLRDVELVWHGEWSDPELIYKGYGFNYYDIDMCLYDDYIEDRNANNNVVSFKEWIKDNAYLAYDYLDNLLECRAFYGGDE